MFFSITRVLFFFFCYDGEWESRSLSLSTRERCVFKISNSLVGEISRRKNDLSSSSSSFKNAQNVRKREKEIAFFSSRAFSLKLWNSLSLSGCVFAWSEVFFRAFSSARKEEFCVASSSLRVFFLKSEGEKKTKKKAGETKKTHSKILNFFFSSLSSSKKTNRQCLSSLFWLCFRASVWYCEKRRGIKRVVSSTRSCAFELFFWGHPEREEKRKKRRESRKRRKKVFFFEYFFLLFFFFKKDESFSPLSALLKRDSKSLQIRDDGFTSLHSLSGLLFYTSVAHSSALFWKRKGKKKEKKEEKASFQSSITHTRG